MALSYSSFVTDLANILVIPSTDANYTTVLPNIIDDSEQRIYRECDFLNTIVTTSSATISANSRNFTLPSSITYVVVESVNALSTNATPIRTQLTPVSKEWIDAVYPTATSSSSVAVPLYFAMVTDQTILMAPPPGQQLSVEIIGTTRPTPLSSANTTTYLTNNLPDLFMAAAAVFGNAYLKNFSAQSDDPRASMSWESHYQSLKQSAIEEETRKKFGSQGWTSKQPNPIATPPRS